MDAGRDDSSGSMTTSDLQIRILPAIADIPGRQPVNQLAQVLCGGIGPLGDDGLGDDFDDHDDDTAGGGEHGEPVGHCDELRAGEQRLKRRPNAKLKPLLLDQTFIAALTNAIEDALGPFGVKIVEQYLPPSRILELMGSITKE